MSEARSSSGTGLSYGWIVVAAGMLMTCIGFGAMFSLAVFLQPVAVDTGWSRSAISTAATLDFLSMGVAALCWGAMSDRFGARAVVLVGSALLGVGLVAASRATSLLEFQAMFGVVVGIAAGSFYAPMIAAVTEWHSRHRSLAVALVSAGMGMGSMTISPLAAWLVEVSDWRTAMLAIGVSAWLLVPVAFLVRSPSTAPAGAGHPMSTVMSTAGIEEAYPCRIVWTRRERRRNRADAAPHGTAPHDAAVASVPKEMEPIYRVEGATAETSAFAGGPWDPRLQHGAAPSSLVCWAVEHLPASASMRVARLTVDFMRPVPVAPLTIATEVVREGRKTQIVAVRLLVGGTEAVRATVLRVRRLEQVLPVEAPWPPIDAKSPEASRDPTEPSLSQTPFLSGLETKVAKGSFGTPGPAAVWFRASRPIVEGAPLSPLMRAAIAADFCNGTSTVLDFGQWTFINGDLTLSLAREPIGEWILLDAETWVGPDSVGIAAGRLADRDGYFGRAVQSVLFEKR